MSDYRYTQLEELEQKIEETKSLLEDPALAELAQEELRSLEAEKKALEESIQASKEKKAENLDERNILVEVKGAAGGDEAKLWAEELLRMYTRFAQRKGFTVEKLEENVIKLSGRPGAFGALKYEAGVHRVQRIPETEKKRSSPHFYGHCFDPPRT